MKITEHLKSAKETLFSIEILPPLKGKSIQSIFDGIDPLMEFKPAFVDVTYHREEYIYKKRDGGYLEKVSIRKRPGTVGICAAIMNKYDVEAVPHIICGGFTREETENALIDLQFLGIDNVLALRGDSIKTESQFVPEPGGHNYAIDLVKQIKDMNPPAGFPKTWPKPLGSVRATGMAANRVSLVPREMTTLPGAVAPMPTSEAGLSPVKRAVWHLGEKPYFWTK